MQINRVILYATCITLIRVLIQLHTTCKFHVRGDGWQNLASDKATKHGFAIDQSALFITHGIRRHLNGNTYPNDVWHPLQSTVISFVHPEYLSTNSIVIRETKIIFFPVMGAFIRKNSDSGIR